MRKLNIYKVFMAVVLSVCAVLLVFYERDEIHSNAVENVSEAYGGILC